MGTSRARGVALRLVVAVVVAAVVAAVGLAPAQAAERLSTPTVDLRQAGSGEVIVKGRTATARAKVRIDRYTPSGWVRVKKVRARHHRYRATLQLTLGTTVSLRAVSDKRSRKFQVRMPAAPVPEPPATYDGCGVQPRKADGTPWSCTFNDDFNGTSLDRTKWVPQTAFLTGDAGGAFACYVDDPDNVSVSSGMLNLTVRKEAEAVPCGSPTSTVLSPYTAGSLSTYHLFSQQYGRFEARIRNTATTAPGLHEAFWLWPDDRVTSALTWPAAGEIDISETYSNYPDLSIPFLHYSADAGGPQPGLNTAWNCTARRGQWNTYTLEWSATRLAIKVNGNLCLTNTSGDPAFQKPYILMLTQALGSGANVLDGAPIPATMNVDYVRVWK